MIIYPAQIDCEIEIEQKEEWFSKKNEEGKKKGSYVTGTGCTAAVGTGIIVKRCCALL